MYIRGNSIIYDSWVLANVLDKQFIDTRNTGYDFDISKEFTWEFRDLVEIKKRKRIVDRVVAPTVASFTRLISAEKRKYAIKRDALITSRKPHPCFRLFEFFGDKFEEDKSKLGVMVAKNILNETNAGKPLKT